MGYSPINRESISRSLHSVARLTLGLLTDSPRSGCLQCHTAPYRDLLYHSPPLAASDGNTSSGRPDDAGKCATGVGASRKSSVVGFCNPVLLGNVEVASGNFSLGKFVTLFITVVAAPLLGLCHRLCGALDARCRLNGTHIVQ